jgi:hypothetical protein
MQVRRTLNLHRLSEGRMGSSKTRLELTWIGKENRPRLEPRVLLEDPGKFYPARHRVGDHDIFVLPTADVRPARPPHPVL